jgi:hypothetical protein
MIAHATLLGISSNGDQKVISQGGYIEIKAELQKRVHPQFYKLFMYASNGVTLSRKMPRRENPKEKPEPPQKKRNVNPTEKPTKQ